MPKEHEPISETQLEEIREVLEKDAQAAIFDDDAAEDGEGCVAIGGELGGLPLADLNDGSNTGKLFTSARSLSIPLTARLPAAGGVGDFSTRPGDTSEQLPTRVLNDVFHVMLNLTPMKSHPSAKDFQRELRDALSTSRAPDSVTSASALPTCWSELSDVANYTTAMVEWRCGKDVWPADYDFPDEDFVSKQDKVLKTYIRKSVADGRSTLRQVVSRAFLRKLCCVS